MSCEVCFNGRPAVLPLLGRPLCLDCLSTLLLLGLYPRAGIPQKKEMQP